MSNSSDGLLRADDLLRAITRIRNQRDQTPSQIEMNLETWRFLVKDMGANESVRLWGFPVRFDATIPVGKFKMILPSR